jgi:hypothetical protein
VVTRKTATRLTQTAAAAAAGGGFSYGFSQVAPQSLAVLGATLVVSIVVVTLASYKLIDRLLRHIEQQPPQHLSQDPERRPSDQLGVRAQVLLASEKQEDPG